MEIDGFRSTLHTRSIFPYLHFQDSSVEYVTYVKSPRGALVMKTIIMLSFSLTRRNISEAWIYYNEFIYVRFNLLRQQGPNFGRILFLIILIGHILNSQSTMILHMICAQWKFWICDWKELIPLTDCVSNIIGLLGRDYVRKECTPELIPLNLYNYQCRTT